LPEEKRLIELKEITLDNFWKVIELKVKDSQKKFVANNAVSIAQSKIQPECIPLAIYSDDILVGFLMYCIDRTDNNYWFYRVMIDENFQGKGYAKKAMEIIINKIKEDKTHNKIRISAVPENITAKELYKKFGFKLTGEMDDDEEIMELKY
jgi:diamine N-acetyltransferase